MELVDGGSWHPAVAGYRRLGRYIGKAIAGRVSGMFHRSMRVTRWWMASATELRFEVDSPVLSGASGAGLVLDTSGDLIDMTYMDAGRGWRAADRDGLVPITAVGTAANMGGTGSATRTGSITFNRAPDLKSLRAVYANSSGSTGGGLGGSYIGPRGCFRSDDGETVPDLVLPLHTFLLPAELS